jgi:superfamily I DNA/RNA helicase
MVNRIGDVMPLGYEEPWVCTFHSFAERILSNEVLDRIRPVIQNTFGT